MEHNLWILSDNNVSYLGKLESPGVSDLILPKTLLKISVNYPSFLPHVTSPGLFSKYKFLC